MIDETILNEVRSLISKTFEFHISEITRDTVTDDIPGWDSLSHTLLASTLERAFGIKLESANLPRNVGDLVAQVAGEIRRGPSSGRTSAASDGKSLGGDVASQKKSEKPDSPKACSDVFPGWEGFFRALAAKKDVAIPWGRLIYHCRLRIVPAAKFLCVQLNAAKKPSDGLPVFSRWNYGKLLRAHILSICDPTFFLNGAILVGWYLGNREENATAALPAIAAQCAAGLGLPPDRIVFYGSSGGGFAAIQAAAASPNGKAIAINPQIGLQHYFRRATGNYLKNIAGCSSQTEARRVFGERWNAIDSVRRAIAEERPPKIVIVQNINDSFHFKEHFGPFAEAFGLSLTEKASTAGDGFMSILYDGPKAHGGESPAEIARINDEAIPFLLGFQEDIHQPFLKRYFRRLKKLIGLD